MHSKLSPRGPDEIKSALADAPTSVQNNVNLVLEGMGIPDLSTIEWLNRKIPYLDVKHIVNILIWGGLATITHHIATKGGSDDSIYKPLYDYIDTYTPEWFESTLNAVNETLFFFVKGKDYGDGAVLGMISRVSILTGFIKGVIPWRGDQISFKKEFQSRMKEGIDNGTYPYMGSGHTVCIGMRDSLAYSEINDEGDSLFKAIREQKGDMVLIQSDEGAWHPTALKTKPNDEGIYVNNPALQEEGVATAENYLPAIISGAYKANNILINCKDIPLFSDYIVDNEGSKQPGIDLSAARHLVRHATELRSETHEGGELLNVTLVVPEYTRQKVHKDERDNLETTVRNNFNRDGEDYNVSYISRERIFIDMLADSIIQNGLGQKMIYIDTEGSDIKGAERCKEMLAEKLGSNPDMIIINPSDLEEFKEIEKVAVLLRSSNRMIGATSRHSMESRGVTHVFYPQTSREDLVRHNSHEGEQKRIPIPYNSEIGVQVLENLT